MADGSDSIKRRPIVCARMSCSKCNNIILGRPVPDDCEYAIIHLMETGIDVCAQGRRTGKTTMLVESTIELSKRFQVYYVCPNLNMLQHIKAMVMARCNGMPKEIVLLSVNQIKHGRFRGYGSGMMVLDEVRPEEIEQYLVPKGCYPIALARWT